MPIEPELIEAYESFHRHRVTVPDPQQIHTQQAMFVKNLSLLGAALLIAHFGAGPLSLDAWLSR